MKQKKSECSYSERSVCNHATHTHTHSPSLAIQRHICVCLCMSVRWFFLSSHFQFCPHHLQKMVQLQMRFQLIVNWKLSALSAAIASYIHSSFTLLTKKAKYIYIHIIVYDVGVFFRSFHVCFALRTRFKWPQFEHNHILITYLHSFFLSTGSPLFATFFSLPLLFWLAQMLSYIHVGP